MSVGAGDRSRTWLLAVAAAAWSVWCLVAVEPAAYIVILFAKVAGRSELRQSVPFGVAVELVVIGLSAWLAFQIAARLRPPRAYWAVGPAGYFASYLAWMALERLLGGRIVGLDAGSIVRLVAAMGVSSAGAYLGLAGTTTPPVRRATESETSEPAGPGA